MNQKRIDQIIQEFFPEHSRKKIQEIITIGGLKVLDSSGAWKVVYKPGAKYEPTTLDRKKIQFSVGEDRSYVSRGALKLKAAVEHFSIKVLDGVALDVGQSTGGFTDYLLSCGARRVCGVDVGREQLASRLKKDPRVIYAEKVNARQPLSQELLNSFFPNEEKHFFDLIVVDVSFISLSHIVCNLVPLMNDSSQLVCLIKPQFELGPKELNKKGVVKDPAKQQQAVEKIIGVFEQNALNVKGYISSPIEGENGNKEFLILGARP